MPWWMKYVKMDEANGGDGGKGGTGGTGDIKMDDVVKQINMLTQIVGGLAGGMQKMQETVSGMPDMFKELLPNDQNRKQQNTRQDDDFSQMDLEQLDRGQFATLLLSKMLGKVDELITDKMKGIDEKIGSVRDTVARDLGSRQFNEVQAKHADVLEWRDEIRDILEKNPNLSLAQAYTLAKNDNPAKAEEVSKKYAKPDDGKGGKGDVFFGLTPTSTNAAPSEKSGRRLPFNQAAEKALDDVMAQLGGGNIDSVARIS